MRHLWKILQKSIHTEESYGQAPEEEGISLSLLHKSHLAEEASDTSSQDES